MQVFLDEGGVGKTTCSAANALRLADDSQASLSRAATGGVLVLIVGGRLSRKLAVRLDPPLHPAAHTLEVER